MSKRIVSVLLAVSVFALNCLGVYADSAPSDYPMIVDNITGSNIESFEIRRPDPAALRNNVVNASSFGLSVDKEDNYAAFASALDYCRDHPNTHLVIDRGVYHFRTDSTLQLKNLNNVLIDGNGAEFIFQTQKQFALDGCDGVEIRNLIIDWNWEEDRVASLVQIQNKNKADKTFEIVFLELDEVDENIPIVSFQQYDNHDYVPGTYGSWRTFNPVEVPGSVTDVEKVEPNVLRIHYSDSFTTSFQNEEVYILRHYTYGGAVFNVHGGSHDITFDNVSIYGSAGMGFVFGEEANHFQIINSYIGLRPGSEDKHRMSTSADGIHILNTDGYFRISNCDLSYTGDDIINIHDDMLKITSFESRSKFDGYVTGGFVQRGDKVRVYNENMEDIGFESEVESFVRHGNGGTLTLKDALPSSVAEGFYVYRASTKTHNYAITDNYIHETKGRGALLNAPDGLFENNTLYRTVSECVQVRVDVSENSNKIWYEGSGASNVVINSNVFDECAFGGAPNIITIDCNVGTNSSVLSDVHITNNEFKNCYGAKNLITADNISDLYIENNAIADCNEISISTNCGAVINSGNVVSSPSASCPHTDTKMVMDRAPGCFEYGSTGKTYCNQCHTIIRDFTAIRPLGSHQETYNVIDVPPTCTEDGSSSNVCSLCRGVVSTEVLPATGHVSVTDPAVPATTTSYGLTEGSHCGECGAVLVARQVVPKLSSTAPGQPSAPSSQPSSPSTPSGSAPAGEQPEGGVAGFVERLYTVALGRKSDPNGKAAWIAAIRGGESGAEAAKGFLFSDEFLNKNMSENEFVTILYKTFFDRQPDTAGLNAWVAALGRGESKQDVIMGFINSTEWANVCLRYGIISGGTGVPSITVEPSDAVVAFATRLYTTCLKRSPDQNGLMAWARQLANLKDTGSNAAHGFFFSDEMLNNPVSNEEFVTRLYLTFMDRQPDAAGKAAWVGQLNAGVSREEVFQGFAQSTEFGSICANYGIIR